MVKSNARHKQLQSSPSCRLHSPSSHLTPRDSACLALAVRCSPHRFSYNQLRSRPPSLPDLKDSSASEGIMHGNSVVQSESFKRSCEFEDCSLLEKERTGAEMEEVAVDIEPECGRQRLQQHWMRMAGNVSIPDSWGREQHLRDWAECSCVEDALHPPGLMLARNALINH